MTQIINDKLVGQPLLTVYHRLRTEIPMILSLFPNARRNDELIR